MAGTSNAPEAVRGVADCQPAGDRSQVNSSSGAARARPAFILKLEAVLGIDGAHALRMPGQQKVYALNETALALWQLCDGATTPTEMVSVICEVFPGDPAQVAADVERALADLTEIGLIAWRSDQDGAT